MVIPIRQTYLLSACLLFTISPLSDASPYPDAGTLFREHKDDSFGKQPKENKQTPKTIKVEQATIKPELDNNELLLVTAYQLHGNSLLSQKEVEQALKPYTNVTLSTSGIHEAATALQKAYIDKGLFAAEVIIPPQSVSNNQVILYVYEGVLAKDGVHIVNSGKRVNDDVVSSILQSNLHIGELIQSEKFERSILLIDDLPGLAVKSSLYPGAEVGTANFLLETKDEALVSGNIDADNFGSYYTGEARLGTTIYVNSPTKNGDQLTLRLVTSGSDSNYGFVQYDFPVGGDGFRIGSSLDYLDYTLGKEFRSFDAEGSASELHLFSSYPLIRSRHNSLQARADLVHLALKDDNNTGQLAERGINSLVFQLIGDYDDDLFANGVNYYSIGVTIGDVDIKGGELYKEFDRQLGGTAGSYGKLNFDLSRLQHIKGNLSGYLSLSGQLANKNLDTSQKFYIGGPYTVAGYPIGELSGDDAALIYADLRYDFFDLLGSGSTQLSLFYSQGWAKLYHDTWDGWNVSNSQLKNEITIKSFGLAVHQTWQDKFLVKFIAGRQLGSNPGSDPLTGEDSDNSDSDYRLWAQGVYYF